MLIKKIIKGSLLPWHVQFFKPRGISPRPYFGPFTKPYGGPDLKVRKLKNVFGNHVRNPNIVYMVSGKPLPLVFLRMAKKRGLKIILNQDGVYYPGWYKGDYLKGNADLCEYHALSDFVIFQSKFCLESSEKFIAKNIKPSQILHNGVDTEKITPFKNDIDKSTVHVLSAGYFNASNSYVLECLFKAIKILNQESKQFRLLIAGKIEEGEPALIHKTREWDIESYVKFVGQYDANSISETFKPADIFVHLKHNDPCPSAVLEAMAMGLPVVYSASGGTPELVGPAGVALKVPETYEDCPLPEPAAVAAGIMSAVSNYTALSKLARERVELHFSIKKWVGAHSKIMESLIR